MLMEGAGRTATGKSGITINDVKSRVTLTYLLPINFPCYAIQIENIITRNNADSHMPILETLILAIIANNFVNYFGLAVTKTWDENTIWQTFHRWVKVRQTIVIAGSHKSGVVAVSSNRRMFTRDRPGCLCCPIRLQLLSIPWHCAVVTQRCRHNFFKQHRRDDQSKHRPHLRTTGGLGKGANSNLRCHWPPLA